MILQEPHVHASRELAAHFEAYGDWRRRLSAGISGLHEWLTQQDLADAQTDQKVQELLERLHQDKLVVAFVAEFSRGKSELINAIFFADFGQRLLPSSAGRTTMCPTELLYDATRAPSIRLLPIETRLKDATVTEFKNYADEWVTIPLDLSSADRMSEALARVSQVKHVPVGLARKYGLHGDEDFLAALDAAGRRRGRDPVLAPCGDQFPASAAAAGPRHSRHAGIERDRHRAGTHAQPAPQRARRAVHPCGRRRRDQDRPRRVEPAPRGRRPVDAGRPHRDPEQDRRPVGRAQERRRGRSRDRPPGEVVGEAPRHSANAGVRGHRAEGPARQGQRRRRAAREEPPAGARGRPVAQAHSGQARHRRRGDAGGGSRARGQRAGAARRAPERHRRAADRAPRAARQESGRRPAHDEPREGGEGEVRAWSAALHRAAHGVHAADHAAPRRHRPRRLARQRRTHPPEHRGQPVHAGNAHGDDGLLRHDPARFRGSRAPRLPRSTI